MIFHQFLIKLINLSSFIHKQFTIKSVLVIKNILEELVKQLLNYMQNSLCRTLYRIQDRRSIIWKTSYITKYDPKYFHIIRTLEITLKTRVSKIVFSFPSSSISFLCYCCPFLSSCIRLITLTACTCLNSTDFTTLFHFLSKIHTTRSNTRFAQTSHP